MNTKLIARFFHAAIIAAGIFLVVTNYYPTGPINHSGLLSISGVWSMLPFFLPALLVPMSTFTRGLGIGFMLIAMIFLEIAVCWTTTEVCEGLHNARIYGIVYILLGSVFEIANSRSTKTA
jgi:hypothetical protein